MDDVMVLESGDQIGADCVVLEAQGIEVNESMITGESVAVKKHEGDEMLSGSFLVAEAVCKGYHVAVRIMLRFWQPRPKTKSVPHRKCRIPSAGL